MGNASELREEQRASIVRGIRAALPSSPRTLPARHRRLAPVGLRRRRAYTGRVTGDGVARMLVVVNGVTLLCAAVSWQGIYVLRTRRLGWFFTKRFNPPETPLSRPRAVLYASIYLLGGAGVFVAFVHDVVGRLGAGTVQERLQAHSSNLSFLLLFAVSGAWALCWPRNVVGWSMPTRPQAGSDWRILFAVRLMGLAMLIFWISATALTLGLAAPGAR